MIDAATRSRLPAVLLLLLAIAGFVAMSSRATASSLSHSSSSTSTPSRARDLGPMTFVSARTQGNCRLDGGCFHSCDEGYSSLACATSPLDRQRPIPLTTVCFINTSATACLLQTPSPQPWYLPPSQGGLTDRMHGALLSNQGDPGHVLRCGL
jgi:hypothetical protein